MRTNETQSFSPLKNGAVPGNILLIRFHAIGDVAITLPACVALRDKFPNARIDYLTAKPAVGLIDALSTFDAIHSIKETYNSFGRAKEAMAITKQLRPNHYDMVIDLQRNWVSRSIRLMLRPKYWGEFDRYFLKLAGERVLETFQGIGFSDILLSYKLQLRKNVLDDGLTMLQNNGWNGTTPLVVLNPAGLWTSRNWPLENYILLAKQWLEREPVQFVILGTKNILDKARLIKEALNYSLIDLVNKTTLAQAFSILQHSSVVISEDSGLMHMAWVSGIPTVALFGSTRHQWSAPMGDHSHCFHSGDLACGDCMEPVCKFGDVHCLTRLSPATVLESALKLQAQGRQR